MAIIIIDNGSKHIRALIHVFPSAQVLSYKTLPRAHIQKNDLIILSGGHTIPILWHKKEYANEAKLIKKHKGPIIGICLGFELIAHVYGSHLHFLNNRRAGMVQIRSEGKNSIVPSDVKIEVFEAHNWSVPRVKSPLVALAVSDDGVEVLKHKRKPIYAVQFHPEKSPKEASRAIFDAILEAVGAKYTRAN
jgi:GMP synthase-like glutamine amidotransferase